jgi:hypothetical protein
MLACKPAQLFRALVGLDNVAQVVKVLQWFRHVFLQIASPFFSGFSKGIPRVSRLSNQTVTHAQNKRVSSKNKEVVKRATACSPLGNIDCIVCICSKIEQQTFRRNSGMVKRSETLNWRFAALELISSRNNGMFAKEKISKAGKFQTHPNHNDKGSTQLIRQLIEPCFS